MLFIPVFSRNEKLSDSQVEKGVEARTFVLCRWTHVLPYSSKMVRFPNYSLNANYRYKWIETWNRWNRWNFNDWSGYYVYVVIRSFVWKHKNILDLLQLVLFDSLLNLINKRLNRLAWCMHESMRYMHKLHCIMHYADNSFLPPILSHCPKT